MISLRNVLIALIVILIVAHFWHGGIPLMFTGPIGFLLLLVLVLVLAGVL